MQYNTIQCNTIQYNAIQYNTIQYNTIQHDTMQYNTIQCNTIQYNTVQFNAMRYNAVHSHSFSAFVATCTGHVSPRCCLRENCTAEHRQVARWFYDIDRIFILIPLQSIHFACCAHASHLFHLFLSEVLTALPIFLTFPTSFFLPYPTLPFPFLRSSHLIFLLHNFDYS